VRTKNAADDARGFTGFNNSMSDRIIWRAQQAQEQRIVDTGLQICKRKFLSTKYARSYSTQRSGRFFGPPGIT